MINNKEYYGFTKTKLLTAHGFKLKDPTKGFELENREILFSVPHSVQPPQQIKSIMQHANRCDHMIPLRYYDPNITFYELQYKCTSILKDYFNDMGMPRYILKNNFAKMTPVELADFYIQQSTNVEQLVYDLQKQSNDPDSEYCNFIGPEFINMEERRKHEALEPFIYVNYTVSEVNGCDHYYRDAFPVCAECGEIYACRFCHDDEVMDHKMDRKKFKQMYCLFCKQIGKIGKICEHCNAKVSDICCEVCNTLCKITSSVKPAYHCDKCGLCRVGLAQYSAHCDKCNCCYDSRHEKDHSCQEDTSCPVCQCPMAETITQELSLRCDPKHRIHVHCYDQLMQAGNFTCPLDHKVAIDDDQYAMIRGKVYHLYRNMTIDCMFEDQGQLVKLYQCYDCDQFCMDFYFPEIPSICHGCYGVNCCDRAEKIVFTSEFLKYENIQVSEIEFKKYQEDLSNVKENYPDDKIAEYIMKFRSLNQRLVPKMTKKLNQLTLLQMLEYFGKLNIKRNE